MNYTSGPIRKAIKTVVYGTEGIGKSTFAAQFPDPVFIDTEGSTASMNVKRTTTPANFSEIISQVQYIARHPGEAKTLVIDTIDWAERMAVKSICDAKKLTGLEDMSYGKGYVYVYEDMGRLLNALNECIDNGVNVIVSKTENGLTDSDVAKIRDIVISEASVTADAIKIMENEAD